MALENLLVTGPALLSHKPTFRVPGAARPAAVTQGALVVSTTINVIATVLTK
jgi:hypothetical protein